MWSCVCILFLLEPEVSLGDQCSSIFLAKWQYELPICKLTAIGEWTLEVINNYDYCFYQEKLLRSWDNIYIRVVLIILAALPFLSYKAHDQGLKISCPMASPVDVYQLCFGPNYVVLDTQRKHGLCTEHYLNKGAKAKQCLNVLCQLGQCCKSWMCVGCLRTFGCVKSRLEFNTSCRS